MRQKNGAETLGVLTEQEHIRKLFVLCWIVYCTSYLGRLNYSSAMPLMISEGIFDTSGAGFISMLYFFAYGIGQMVNGFIGDHVNPKKMIFNGLFFSGVSNMAMGLCRHFWVMAVLWGINGYFQAMIWAPIIRIFAEMMDEKNKINSSVNIVTSQLIGTLLSYLLSAAVLAVFPWTGVFAAAAVILLGASFLWMNGFAEICTHAQCPAAEVQEEKQKEKKQIVSFKTLLLTSGMTSMCIPVMVHGMLKDGVIAWVPAYISESFTVSASFSILLTTVLPVINLSGAYIARFVYVRVRESVAKSVSIFFGIAALALLCLYQMGQISPILSVIFLAVITASMMAVNTLVVNIYPLRFHKYGRVSGVSGFLNALAYLGTAVSTYAIGVLVQYKGWQTTIFVWLSVTAVAGTLSVLAIRTENVKRRTL